MDVEDSHPEPASAFMPLGMALLVVIVLAVDELNPVKILCSYTAGFLTEAHVAFLAVNLLLILLFDQRQHVIYYAMKTFFRCTLNTIFFRSVEIAGIENLPRDGPVILTGNHNNQFVDGLLLLSNCPREISFMIAKKSWDRPLVGFLARCFHCIPVSRPQDAALKGDGLVYGNGSGLRGEGTRFSAQVKPGSLLELKGHEKVLKVKEVISDTELIIDGDVPQLPESGATYKVMPKVDQSSMYDAVHNGLREGKCLGIFPEGGSHDRTDLLPLKAGVAIIALDAFCKHHMTVPIVPVGLNYFQGHRFGGRVVVEFGAPIKIPEEIYAQHETDRRGACDALLQLVTSAMRSVIVPTPDYHTLQQVYMARRLYVRDGLILSGKKSLDLTRRFAVGTLRVLQLLQTEEDRETASSVASSAKASLLSQDDRHAIQEIHKELDEYMAVLKRLGMRDYQVPQIGWWSLGHLIGRLMYFVVTMGLGVFPNLTINWPVGAIASVLAAEEQRKALKASTVKLAARDVVMSYKIIYVLVLVPCLWIAYAVVLSMCTPWSITSRILFLAAMPLFAFLGMKASEQGVRAYSDLVPLFARFSKGTRRELDALPRRRAALQRKIIGIVKLIGPRLGELYFQTEVDWIKEMDTLHTGSSPVQSPGGTGRKAWTSAGGDGHLRRRSQSDGGPTSRS